MASAVRDTDVHELVEIERAVLGEVVHRSAVLERDLERPFLVDTTQYIVDHFLRRTHEFQDLSQALDRSGHLGGDLSIKIGHSICLVQIHVDL